MTFGEVIFDKVINPLKKKVKNAFFELAFQMLINLSALMVIVAVESMVAYISAVSTLSGRFFKGHSRF
jgi:hypothetical protein